ncbi:hypothetical protein [Mucilaginibacter paludis]|uniref:Outer membrane protein beta-barrel domain-containing protein n=1 Tax=Mucilaginibacter paludis DSM 18603 TaxID=714943 RepID=H1YBD8_9SPHI|nr:hypothetical protein [Mucilaginibacter paludis]EHQ31192.1 hypothetical protein Mucpa_7149 [Mucilaginibacter paludis DSM 18603]
MRNSARYQKLWRKKMDGLPVKEDMNLAWANMQQALDEQMPVLPIPTNNPGYLSGLKLIKLLSYLLPAVALIGTGIYFAVPALKKDSPNRANKCRVSSIHLVKSTADKQDTWTDSVVYRGKTNVTATDGLLASSAPYNNGLSKVLNQATKEQLVIEAKGKAFIIPERGKDSASVIPSSVDGRSPVNYTAPEVKNIKKYERPGLISTRAQYDKGRLSHLSANKHIAARSGSVINRSSRSSLNLLADSGTEDIHSAQQKAAAFKKSDSILRAGIDDIVSQPKSDPSIWLTTGNSAPLKDTVLSRKEDGTSKGGSISGQGTGVIQAKQLKSKQVKNHTAKEMITPPYNYGIEAGLNAGNGNGGLYFGVFGSYTLKNRLLVNAGFRLNTPQSLSGEFEHVSYYRPDSLPPFKFIDERKVMVLHMPITLEYKLSNLLSIKTGPVISLAIKQSEASTTLGAIVDQRDTVYHGAEVKSALLGTGVNKLSFGFTGGLSLQIRSRFSIEGSYQLFSPFKISNALGGYSKRYQTFQAGITYRFK